MQLGMTKNLARRFRKLHFGFELDESPYDAVFSLGLGEPAPVNSPFAASANWSGVKTFKIGDSVTAYIDEGSIFEAQVEKGLRIFMERGIDQPSSGFLTYSRFNMSPYEIELINTVYPKDFAMPFATRLAAMRTLDLLKRTEPEYAPNLVLDNPYEGVWVLKYDGPIGAVSETFTCMREAREFLGTGMSARQALFVHGQIAPELNHRLASLEEIQRLTDDICKEYISQFAWVHRVNADDVFLRRNGTAVLVDVLHALGGDLTVATVGVPYSDTPITIEKVTGRAPINSRSYELEDIADNIGKADILLVELGDNPLLKAPDLFALNEQCLKDGTMMIVDLSVIGSLNVDLEKLFALQSVAGVYVSTTKVSRGNLTGGAFFSNRNCPYAKSEYLRNELQRFGVADMFVGDAGIHLCDMKTFHARQRTHNDNALEIALFLSELPGITVNYPTENGSAARIEPFLKEGWGFGCVLSIEFDRSIYSVEQIVAILNELPNRMPNTLSFGLPDDTGLAYAATVFPRQPKSVSGVDPFIYRVSMGCKPGTALRTYEAIRGSIEHVMGPDFLVQNNLLSRT
jgi:cystathionine beta-lyase/cystathionine gamma-synthase